MVCVVALAIEDSSPIQAGRTAVGYGEGDAEPYLSLAVFDDVDESAVGEAASSFAAATRVVEITITGLGIFPNENPVIYASVLASAALMGLQKSLYDGFGDLAKRMRPTYVPGSWVPHISLSITDRLGLSTDVETLMSHRVRGVYRCSTLLLVTGPPAAVVERFELQ